MCPRKGQYKWEKITMNFHAELIDDTFLNILRLESSLYLHSILRYEFKIPRFLQNIIQVKKNWNKKKN